MRKITNYRNWYRYHGPRWGTFSCPREMLEQHGYVLVAQLDILDGLSPRMAVRAWLESNKCSGNIIHRWNRPVAQAPELEIYASHEKP